MRTGLWKKRIAPVWQLNDYPQNSYSSQVITVYNRCQSLNSEALSGDEFIYFYKKM